MTYRIPYQISRKNNMPIRKSSYSEMLGFTTLTLGYLCLVALVYPSFALALGSFGALVLYKLGARWYSCLSLYTLPYIFDSTSEPIYQYALIGATAIGAWIIIQSMKKESHIVRPINNWVFVALASIAYGLILFVNAIRIHTNLDTAAYDLGLFDNIFYNISIGNGMLNPMERNNIDQTHFHVHFSPIFYILTPLYSIAQRAEALIAIQALTVVTSALALYGLGKQLISKNSAAIIAICWTLYVPLQGGYYFNFHEVVVGPTILFMIGTSLLKGHILLPWFLTLLLACVKEDYPILCIPAIILFGSWSKRLPLSFCLSALLITYFVAIQILWIIPNAENWTARIYGDLGANNVVELLRIVVTNPVKILESMWTNQKLFNLLELLVPAGFLALLSPWTYFMLAGPLIILYAPNDTVFSSNFFQYTFSTAPFIFLGTIAVLKKYNNTKQLNVSLLILALGLLVQYNFGMLGGKPFRIGFTTITNPVEIKNQEAYEELLSIIKTIPKTSIVAADDNLAPHISNRAKAYTLKYWENDTLKNWREEEKPSFIIRWRTNKRLKLEGYEPSHIGNSFEVLESVNKDE